MRQYQLRYDNTPGLTLEHKVRRFAKEYRYIFGHMPDFAIVNRKDSGAGALVLIDGVLVFSQQFVGLNHYWVGE